MDLVTLVQFILLILTNLNFKSRKYKLEELALAILTNLLGVYQTRNTTINNTLLH